MSEIELDKFSKALIIARSEGYAQAIEDVLNLKPIGNFDDDCVSELSTGWKEKIRALAPKEKP